MNSWKPWLHGLFAVIIGGAASGAAAAFAEPQDFNFSHSGLIAFAKVIVVGGLIPAAAYLKQSPLPPENQTLTAK
jgi:hypothetical protein